ncbi:MAG: YbaY family lipoprotein [Chloroflexota bacterium]
MFDIVRRALRWRVLLAALLLAGFAVSEAQAQEQADERCFPETGYCISGRIRQFWEQNGGLAVFGLPISPQREESFEGEPFQAQWFERARLELHPENQPPYDVQLGRLGALQLLQEGRDWFAFPRSEPREECLFFPETGHNVCGAFLRAWQANGIDLDGSGPVAGAQPYAESLALFGLPLSDEMTETVEGQEYTVQWFERARFELHPENQPPYDVLLGRLGAALVGYNEATPATLIGTLWRLESFGPDSAPVEAVAASPATIDFGSDSRVSGMTGCNGFGGSYRVEGDEIVFESIISTLRACDGPVNQQEREVLRALQGRVRYALSANQLRLLYDGSTLTFVASQPPTAATVTGTVTYRERIALPPDARVQVLLLDISRQDAPATQIAEALIEPGARQVPIPFTLTYDPRQIDERNTYAVRATIEAGGQLLFTTTEAVLVITQGHPTTVELVLQRAS